MRNRLKNKSVYLKKFFNPIFFLSVFLVLLNEASFCQPNDTCFIWVNNVELQPFPNKVSLENKKFLKFGDKIKILDRSGTFFQIKRLEDEHGSVGWVPFDYCTDHKKEIQFFLKNEIIPEDIFIVENNKSEEPSGLSISSFSPGLNFNNYVLKKGCVIYYKNQNLNDQINLTLFETTFSELKPYYKYYFNGNYFVEFAPSKENGFTACRKIYPDSKISKMDLVEAVRLNKVTAIFYGMGKSSGDAICVKLVRNSDNPLQLSVDKGLILKSIDNRYQNMVIRKLKGKYLPEGTYIKQDVIDLASCTGGTFLFEAYCLNLEKDNPSENTFFIFEKLNPNWQLFFNTIEELRIENTEITQIALWKILNETDANIRKHFKLDSEKIKEANKIIKKYRENGGLFPLQ